jgi:hypothetical protein
MIKLSDLRGRLKMEEGVSAYAFEYITVILDY